MSAVGTDHAARQLGPLPQLLVVGLCYRDIETAVEPVFQTPYDAPLVFKGTATVEVQIPDPDAYNH